MSTTSTRARRLKLGPLSAGMLLTAKEFDRARFEDGWRYELINGVLVVSPIAARSERHPNDELGYLLMNYRDSHPLGSSLDLTLYEETLNCGQNRRRADRVIWVGLGRLPEQGEPPSIIVEFVSEGKAAQERDYIVKRAEYRAIRAQEYWVIDRFRRTLTVYVFGPDKDEQKVIPEGQSYSTPLLPGFELPLARLLKLADQWGKKRGQGSE
jgi:Uma2 family endonuclease